MSITCYYNEKDANKRIYELDAELTALRATVERLTTACKCEQQYYVDHITAERQAIAAEVVSFADDCLMGRALKELHRLAGNIERGEFVEKEEGK